MTPHHTDPAAFDAYYRKRKHEVDAYLDTVLDVGEEFDDLRRLIDLAVAGGKRVRPTLALLMADVTGCSKERALTHAAVVELLHNATLVADDWADDDGFRRDRPAVWRVLHGAVDGSPDRVEGISTAIPAEADPRTMTVLASHNMHAIALQLVRDPAVLRAMGTGVRDVFRGFYLEGRHHGGGEWSGGYDAYVETNRYKTGGFFALSTWMPAIVAPVGADATEAARTYGESLGVLYQLADDVADGDLPAVVADPEAELQTWYERTVGEIDDLPVDSGVDCRVLLETAPAWACHRMFEQEGVDLEPAFLADLRDEAPAKHPE